MRIVGRTVFLVFLTVLPIKGLPAQTVGVGTLTVEATGKSREKDVRRYLEILAGLKPGVAFGSEEEALAAVEEARILLVNTRYYRGVSCATVFRNNGDGSRVADILFRLEDSWSFFPLPVFKYDSNYGLIYGGVLRFHNIGGTLTDLTAGFRYNPLVWYGWCEWEHIRTGPLLWDIWIFEQFETIRRIDETDTLRVDFDYYSTELKTRTDFRLLPRLIYTVSPGIRFPYGYRIRKDDHSDMIDETGITPSFSHELVLGKVNWSDNRREGYRLSFGHTLDWNIPLRRLRNTLLAEGQLFLNRGVFSLEGRLLSFLSLGGDVELVGEYVRGVRDARLWGDAGVVVNLAAGFTLLDLDKIGEIQLQPFCDLALVHGREPVVSIGLQLLLFVDLFPAWPNTIYAGFDTLHRDEGEYKMYSGLHYDRKKFR